jgi:NAD(P)-dependent dehydrogenase (short-subunit alcohol dehydrogenase family)
MRLTGSSALVTGGASGLGRAAAQLLLAKDATVVVMDLPGSAREQSVKDLGDGALFVPGDVTVPADVERAVLAATEVGSLRVAVAGAGIGPPAKLFGSAGPVAMSRVRPTIEVNLMGTFHVLSYAGHAMAANEPENGDRGVIICTASIAAYEGQVGQVAYAASKSAVVGMTLPAARELADHAIRVMTISPGLFDTPLMASMPEKARLSVGAQVPHPSRLGTPEEYAALLGHIVDNPMLNGEVIRLDGAIRMASR